MANLDREQLRRECADALEALLREQSVTEIPRLSDDIRTLGPTYRSHGELMRAALHDRADNTITWHLIHVLEKFESGA